VLDQLRLVGESGMGLYLLDRHLGERQPED
jgi:ferritin